MAILTFTSASGVGKGTVMRALYESAPKRVRLLTSTTTREPQERDACFGDTPEYEYLSEKEFEREVRAGEFLEIFGKYGARYSTRRTRFLDALRDDRVYLSALFIPAVELFWREAERQKLSTSLSPIFLDLPREEDRHERLRGRGETNEKRFEPELALWRERAKQSPVPFFLLNATDSPVDVARVIAHHFNI